MQYRKTGDAAADRIALDLFLKSAKEDLRSAKKKQDSISGMIDTPEEDLVNAENAVLNAKKGYQKLKKQQPQFQSY